MGKVLTDEESPETSPLRDPFPPRQMISLQDQHLFFWPRRLRIKANEGSRLQPRTVWTKSKYRKEGSMQLGLCLRFIWVLSKGCGGAGWDEDLARKSSNRIF